MKPCNREYLPLCSIPTRMSRDGFAGPNASIYLPFEGIYFFSGAQFTPKNSTVPQADSKFIGGITKQGYSHSSNCSACG